jgi:pre-mRNA-splicing factor ATP-dependent RNA helicase DHX15/PRP43
MTSVGIFDPEGKHPNPLTNEPYSDTYLEHAKKWSKFPGYARGKDILASLRDNNLTIIKSATGTGKTVLNPKFALHFTEYKGKVGVVLPKRTVTRSAAEYAAITLDVPLGSHVGYTHKGKKVIGPDNKIVYMTDGTLVMKAVNDTTLSDFKVIIIDEAHERKVQIDVIMLILKKIMEKRDDLRVIIMSATLDTKKYRKYFSGKIKTNIIEISGKPNYPIDVHFLDKPTKNFLVDGLEIAKIILKKKERLDVLFFITTGKEAFDTCREIRSTTPETFCVELFAEMDQMMGVYAEDRDKFLELGEYTRKLVMATNVAESSLTIDGLKVVIDPCHQLFGYYDPVAMADVLTKQKISKAQALQRRGRVGRTEPGVCHHLLTKEEFDSLDEYAIPEILSQNITMDFLKIINMSDRNYNEGLKMLHQMMDPPTSQQVDTATKLYKFYNIIDDKMMMQPVGEDILRFSTLDINSSLFLIYAYQLHCGYEAAVIVAMIEATKGRITNLFIKNDTICKASSGNAESKKLIKSITSKKGDHLSLLNIYQKYDDIQDKNAWAKKYCIRVSIMNRIKKNAREIFSKLHAATRARMLSRVDNADKKTHIINALKMSHKHMIAENMTPVYPTHKIVGRISRDSVAHFHFTPKQIQKKKFIYNQYLNNMGKYEFSTITFI